MPAHDIFILYYYIVILTTVLILVTMGQKKSLPLTDVRMWLVSSDDGVWVQESVPG